MEKGNNVCVILSETIYKRQTQCEQQSSSNVNRNEWLVSTFKRERKKKKQ